MSNSSRLSKLAHGISTVALTAPTAAVGAYVLYRESADRVLQTLSQSFEATPQDLDFLQALLMTLDDQAFIACLTALG